MDLAAPPDLFAAPASAPEPHPDGYWPIKGPPLWMHQRRALTRSEALAAFAFLFDPGGGKTATVIAEAGRLYLDGEIDTLIVVAPFGVHRQWVAKQFPRWADYDWKGFAWPKGGLNSQRRKRQFEDMLRISEVAPRLRVFTVNFENVRLPKPRRGVKPERPKVMREIDRIVRTSQRGVYFAVDESHRIKQHDAQQTRGALCYGRDVAKVRRILSGSPLLQGVQDLWSQYAFLDRLIIGEPTFWSFRASYCKTAPVPNHPNALRITGAKNTRRLMERLAPYTARVLDTEFADMPELFPDTYEVEMEPEQARVYGQMEELMLAGLRTGEHEGQVITAKIVLTQLGKLQQIASGFVFNEAGEPVWISDGKIEAIRDKVSDLGQSHVVVWAPFVPLLDRLEAALDGAVRYRSLDDLDRWKAKGGPLVANPASGGTGLDGMQEVAHWSLYAANSQALDHRIQSIKRVHRPGQKRPCFLLDFVTAGTRDQVVLDSLKEKRDLGAMTVDKLKDMLL